VRWPDADPTEWIEVRLADFDAPELSQPQGRHARDMLSSIARGHQVDCTATAGRNRRVTSYDRVIATCRVNGRRLGDLLRAGGTPQGGN